MRMIYMTFGLLISLVTAIIAIGSFIAGVVAEKHLSVYDKTEGFVEEHTPMTRQEFQREYVI